MDSDRPDDDVLTELVEVFNGEHHCIVFTFDEYYKPNPTENATWTPDHLTSHLDTQQVKPSI